MRERLLAVAMSLAASSCASMPTFPPSAPSALLGRPVPTIRGVTIDGDGLGNLELRGRPVVIKFFAKYCEPCKRTLPAAERLHRANPRAAFVGVSLDEFAADAREIRDAYRLTFPVVHDAARSLQGRFRVTELPTTFVGDRHGLVRWVGGPAQTEDQLARALDAADR